MKWLTKEIATASYGEINQSNLDPGTVVVDVRDLVDKSGNDIHYISSKIEESLDLLKNGRKIIVCCDYGMSRSNSLAIGIIVKREQISFTDAVSIAKKVVDESGIKIEMLNSVYSALYKNGIKKGTKGRIKNICVTGARGFLGRNLVKEMGNDYNLFCPSSSEIDLIENVIELDLLVKSKKIDCIVHLANPKIFTKTKAIGDTIVMLKNVLDVCRTNETKIVFLSGWEIYSGYKGERLLANENLKANPKGTYGETKWLSELLIKQYASIYGIKYQIVRSGPVFGLGGEKPKFIYNFIEKALKDEEIVTHKYINGDPLLDLLYIADLVSFLSKSIVDDFEGEINVGSGKSMSTFDVAQFICSAIGSKSRLERVRIDDYSANITMDNTLAHSKFGWGPKIKTEEGLLKILESYK